MSKPNSTQNTIHGLEMLQIKILEKIFVMFLISSNFEFPTHVCWKFNNLIVAFPKFESLQNIDITHLSRIHASQASFLLSPKKTGELNVNLQRIIKSFRIGRGLVMDLKHCVKSVQIRSYFWSVFSCIRTEYGDLLHKFPNSVQMQENTDQK